MMFLTALLQVIAPTLGMILSAIGVSDEKKKAFLKAVEDAQVKYRKQPIQVADEERNAEERLAARLKKDLPK